MCTYYISLSDEIALNTQNDFPNKGGYLIMYKYIYSRSFRISLHVYLEIFIEEIHHFNLPLACSM